VQKNLDASLAGGWISDTGVVGGKEPSPGKGEGRKKNEKKAARMHGLYAALRGLDGRVEEKRGGNWLVHSLRQLIKHLLRGRPVRSIIW